MTASWSTGAGPSAVSGPPKEKGQLLQYTDISGGDVIDNMTFGANHDVHHGSHRNYDKMFYIMLNYQNFTDALNHEAINEILTELVKLEKEQDRLNYYISLLDNQEARVIRRVYIDGCTWNQAAKELKVVRRTAYKIKDRALANLAWMYEYMDGITEDDPTAIQ